jgi:folate-binding protein YgfZ
MNGEAGNGLDKELWEGLLEVGVAVRLQDRFGLRVSGADAERYLNGQVTNDVRRASCEQSINACVTDARGRLEGEIVLRREADGAFLLDGPLELHESLAARLGRYAIADDVAFDTVAVSAWHVMGGGRSPGSLRYGLAGQDCQQRPEGVEEVSAGMAERIRIAMGFPKWGSELVVGMLPPEAGIEALTISYEKGCYVGQEVISRMKRAGKVNRRLQYMIASEAREGLAVDEVVGGTLVSADGSCAASVTSATFHPMLDRLVALAYVKGEMPTADSHLFFLERDANAGKVIPSFEVQPAPFREAFTHV